MMTKTEKAMKIYIAGGMEKVPNHEENFDIFYHENKEK